MRPARVTAAVLTTLLLAVAAEAQIPSPTGSVHGTVLDAQTKPIAGAIANLVGPGAARTATTDARGAFRFLGIAPGLHTLELGQTGFHSTRLEVTVQPGKSAVIDVTLQVAGAEEEITVRGELPSQDSRKVETGATYGERELETIPTTRDPWAILRQVPGILLSNVNVGGVRGGAPTGVIGKGAGGGQNTYNVDGVTISLEGVTYAHFDFDSLDSIGVTTGGSDPSLSSPGVTISLVTKRGTNELAGSARALYTDGSQWDYGLELGGPLWRDRIWIWGAGATNSYLGQTEYLPDGEPVRSQDASRHWNAKLTAQLAPANAFTLSYFSHTRLVDGRGAAPDRSKPTTVDVTFPTESFKVEDSQILSKNFFAAFSFSYAPLERTAVPKGGLDAQAYQDVDEIWRNSFISDRQQRALVQAGLTASAFFDTGRLRHELKFGFGYRQAHVESAQAWPADQLVGFAYEPAEAAVTRGMNAKGLNNFYNTYLADTVQAGNLTVNLGARFDYQQSRNLPSAVPPNADFPELLPAVEYEGNSSYPLTWRSVQPRIGATYAMGQDRQTLLRASYSRFGDQLGLEVFRLNAFPGIAWREYYWNDANHNGRVEPPEVDLSELLYRENVNPDDPGSSAPVNQIAGNLEPPETDEFIVGLERQLSTNLSVSLAYTHRRLTGPMFDPLIGTTRASYRYEGNATGTITDPETGFVLDFNEPYFGLTTDPPPNGTVLQNRPDSTQTYNGVELQLLKSFSNGWMLRVGFAYNNWYQHVGPSGIVDPNNARYASGPVVEDGINATWQFKV
ncbi:MAG: TonB-dependent receptor, partial [Thermoanaerobaculia bacterium]